MSLLELSRRLLRGEVSIHDHHPFATANELEEVADGVAFVSSFANVTAVATDDGLVLVDTGSALVADAVHDTVRAWTPAPVRAAVYTHGHIDHVFGTAAFEAEAPLTVYGHRAVDARFDRYARSAGYNAVINQRQFRVPGLRWPLEYRHIDVAYDDRHDVEVAGTRFELHHARGETDDHTWVWVPERRLLCTGDLIIWCCPNAGNPQKVQRYAEDWAVALRTMAALEPEVLLPGHGLPVAEAERMLDFGCGCGRVIRHWSALAGPEIHGSDYNRRLVRWCESNLPFAEFAANELAPPLSFESDFFDLVYAISVFTHLPKELEHAWIDELGRVLKPGGLLFLTTHGDAYVDRLEAEERERYRAGQAVVRWASVAGTNLCTTFHPEAYVRARLAPELELLEFASKHGSGGSLPHDLAVFRKPA